MATVKREVEASGDSVDKAIEAGLKELGVNREEVLAEVLDEGSSGFLGIGSREAKVRLRVKETLAPTPDHVDLETPAPSLEVPLEVEDVEEPATETVFIEEPADVGAVDIEEPAGEELGLEIIKNLLNKMEVEAEATLRQTEPDDLTGERRWVIDIRGKDLGRVIGTRGDTLNALQYITRLMTGHIIRRRANFIVDVEGYRSRREQALARLAERMANKVIKRGRPMSLEPMPPNERRIIHITLRQNDQVYTESFGEGRRRKVRIFPKP